MKPCLKKKLIKMFSMYSRAKTVADRVQGNGNNSRARKYEIGLKTEPNDAINSNRKAWLKMAIHCPVKSRHSCSSKTNMANEIVLIKAERKISGWRFTLNNEWGY